MIEDNIDSVIEYNLIFIMKMGVPNLYISVKNNFN